MPIIDPDVPGHIEYEIDGPDEGGYLIFNFWCARCGDSIGSTSANVAMELVDDHGECREDYSGDEPNLSGDDGPSDAAYRAAMRDAGRGGLLR